MSYPINDDQLSSIHTSLFDATMAAKEDIESAAEGPEMQSVLIAEFEALQGAVAKISLVRSARAARMRLKRAERESVPF